MSIILPTQLWTVQHVLLFTLSPSPFFFFNHLSEFFTFHKNFFTWFKLISLNSIFPQNNSALRNLKCDWFNSFIQVGRNRSHPIFQKFYHTNICTSSLYEFAILHSQTSWIMQVVSYKSFNGRAALLFLLIIWFLLYFHVDSVLCFWVLR